jgi:hypothetical protein
MKKEYLPFIEAAMHQLSVENNPDIQPIDRLEVARQYTTIAAALALAAMSPTPETSVSLTRIQLSMPPEGWPLPDNDWVQPVNPLDAIFKAVGALLAEAERFQEFGKLDNQERAKIARRFREDSKKSEGSPKGKASFPMFIVVTETTQ